VRAYGVDGLAARGDGRGDEQGQAVREHVGAECDREADGAETGRGDQRDAGQDRPRAADDEPAGCAAAESGERRGAGQLACAAGDRVEATTMVMTQAVGAR